MSCEPGKLERAFSPVQLRAESTRARRRTSAHAAARVLAHAGLRSEGATMPGVAQSLVPRQKGASHRRDRAGLCRSLKMTRRIISGECEARLGVP